MFNIFLFYWLFIGPLFLYISIKKQETPNAIYTLLFTLGVMFIIYYFYKWFTLLNKKPLIKTI